MACRPHEDGREPTADDVQAFLLAGLALAGAVCRHDAKAVEEAVVRYHQQSFGPRYASRPDIAEAIDQVGSALGAAELHACGSPTTGVGHNGQRVERYPRKLGAFDPFPPFDEEVFARVTSRVPGEGVAFATRDHLRAQYQAAKRRGDAYLIEGVDGSETAVIREPSINPEYASRVRMLCRAYYDIVCAPKATVPEPVPTE